MKINTLLLCTYLSSCIWASLPAQTIGNSNFKKREAFSVQLNTGIADYAPYLASFGRLAFIYERHYAPGFAWSTGFALLPTGYTSGIGIPLTLDIPIINKRGHGLLLSGGVMAQHGMQPFLLPQFMIKLRLGGKRRFFFESNLFVAQLHGYNYRNRGYPGQYARRDGWGKLLGLGISMGWYRRDRTRQ